MAMLPAFLIIGACKSGTTTLYDELAAHPGTFMPSVKEPNILNRGVTPADLRSLYAEHFRGAGPRALCGDGSTYYTMQPAYPDVSGKARDLLGPELRLIYIMREPVARIVSHLAHDYGVGRIRDTDFDTHALANERYVACSDYARQLAPWIDRFGPDRLLGLRFEDLVADRAAVAARAATFLGLDPAGLARTDRISNPRGSQRQPLPGVGRFLDSELYRRYGHRLPVSLRATAKTLLMRRRSVPDIRLSPETERRLRDRFADLPDRLHALGLPGIRWTADPVHA